MPYILLYKIYDVGSVQQVQTVKPDIPTVLLRQVVVCTPSGACRSVVRLSTMGASASVPPSVGLTLVSVSTGGILDETVS